MLKHLSPRISDLLLILVQRCLLNADIPDLLRQAMVKLFYNRLSSILARHDVLKGGNFAGLPGGSCCDPIITLESIIHDAQLNKNPLWILSQDIQRLSILCDFLISLFTKRTNRVFTAHGVTPAYKVRIGIDQGEVISPLLWVIYIDPLLTVLKNEMNDPYVLSAPSLSVSHPSIPDLRVNNLVFMDDSTLISSTKSGMESMLSITEKFYAINNTSANHNKYVLITNSLSLTSASTPSPISFNLGIVSGSISTAHEILSKNKSHANAILLPQLFAPAKLSARQVVYLHNTVLIPKLEYRMQVTHLSEAECLATTGRIRSVVKHKGQFFAFFT
ncbi:unnamed protein product [Rhizophagus irregularis]|nr:unnamed protein product [Rhizophagus irregularis]